MNTNIGLTHQEAKNILQRVGPNEITAKSRITPLQIFFSQFKSLLVIILIIASIVSFLLGDFIDSLLIMIVVFLNAILGFVQEYKAEQAIAALKKMTVSKIRVMRDGVERQIESREVVPGDIIIIEQGDKIPADCQLIESIHLEINEAALTGESQPVEKDHTDPKKNSIFLGTIVEKGRGVALVLATGMQTKFGSIAMSLSTIDEEKTPLESKLNTLGFQLGILAFVASTTVFVIGYLAHHPFVEIILTSISLAVASVPEGLPAVVTITLAIGMQRMARKKAILRKLSSIEALGSITVIATDKTGTLTQNKMHVDTVFVDNTTFTHDDKKLNKNNVTFAKLLEAGILCNNATLASTGKVKNFDVLGDSTEGSLLLLSTDNDVSIDETKKKGTLIEEFAFDQNLKIMSTIWRQNNNKYVFTKGAPESILTLCTDIMLNGTTKKITKNDIETIQKTYAQFAKDGLRIMALSFRKINNVPKHRKEAEKNQTFLGLVGIADPIRVEVKEAIKIARIAGIRTIMITGDNELTASAIGLKIGLLSGKEEIITGAQLEKLTDAEITNRFDKIAIFARTTPDQKLRIVTLLQKSGHIVAVTGDGVNDALALKQANVGVAMGITGTDVAKEASDMILTDDNYASLVEAVGEGRTIYTNIKTSIKYLVGSNLSEVIAVVVGILLGLPLILIPIQLLYINLVSDGLPAISLAMNPRKEGIMDNSWVVPKKIFGTFDKIWFVEINALTVTITLLAFFIGNLMGNVETARAMAFSTFVFAQSFILLDVGLHNKSVLKGVGDNRQLFLLAFISPFILQLFILYNDKLATLFHVTEINTIQLITVFVLSSVLLLTSEIRKVLVRI